MSIIVTDQGFVSAGSESDAAAARSEAEVMTLPSDSNAREVDFDGAALVRVEFPSFSDGRGFTIARELRQRGFTGHLRASGHVIADQYAMARRSGFDLGADIVEMDIAPTKDGRLAIFHDWTVDCRTEGHGDTRDFTLAQLQALDIGHGYTADGGKTFPFRGKGIGLMPEFADMLDGTKGGQFLVNFKSRDAKEADMLAARLAERPDWRARIWSAYGGQPPSDRANALIADLHAFGTKQAKRCLVNYLMLGWTGFVPAACRNTKVVVPANFAVLLWGWPYRFAERMRQVGSEIVLFGPVALTATGTAGIDSLDQLSLVPEHFDGYVWTNRIDVIGPALAARRPAL